MAKKKVEEAGLLEITKVHYEEMKKEMKQLINEELGSRVRAEVKIEIARIFREMGRQ